ncbi:hypothetical protein RvY_00394 [Ramazzottius varieornatus]|uniref:Uncharacterized protein n=1 Tax=Ramazzottius varieornatus TaxID=947166 RepID=A0A1D1UCM1_RAMVA|nr:hypothetical protein RvY_00394 [Ramazzottius varieornatus]
MKSSDNFLPAYLFWLARSKGFRCSVLKCRQSLQVAALFLTRASVTLFVILREKLNATGSAEAMSAQRKSKLVEAWESWVALLTNYSRKTNRCDFDFSSSGDLLRKRADKN